MLPYPSSNNIQSLAQKIFSELLLSGYSPVINRVGHPSQGREPHEEFILFCLVLTWFLRLKD